MSNLATRGYGNGVLVGTISLIVTRGYSVAVSLIVPGLSVKSHIIMIEDLIKNVIMEDEIESVIVEDAKKIISI